MTARRLRPYGDGSPPPARARGETGATLVEFALIIPVFALLLFATIDFGLVFGGFITLRNGTDAAARLAAVSQIDPSCTTTNSPMSNPMLCTLQNRVGKEFQGIESGTVQVNYFFPGGQAAGNLIKVCASVPLKSTTSFTGPFLNGKRISASSTVRLEQTPAWPNVTNFGSLPCS